MTYPTPANITGLADLFNYANTVIGQGMGSEEAKWYGVLIVIGLYAVVFSSYLIKGERLKYAFVMAGWITSFTTILLRWADIVTTKTTIIVIIITIVAYGWIFITRDR